MEDLPKNLQNALQKYIVTFLWKFLRKFHQEILRKFSEKLFRKLLEKTLVQDYQIILLGVFMKLFLEMPPKTSPVIKTGNSYRFFFKVPSEVLQKLQHEFLDSSWFHSMDFFRNFSRHSLKKILSLLKFFQNIFYGFSNKILLNFFQNFF